ncbi:MAG: hypothetical protein AB1757_07095 [Acidobacteriota bacterium]
MKRLFTASVAVLIAFALTAGSMVAAWQGAAAIKKPTENHLEATREILDSVSRLRELAVKQPVKSGAKSREQIKESVIRDLDESNTPEEIEGSAKTLKKLGLIPKDFQLRDYLVALLAEQVAGYYDPKTQYFYLASWIPLGEQKTVIAHELCHALQDQHFDLRRFEKWPQGDSDAETAAHALAEGEATIVMYQYEFGEKGIPFDVTKLPPLTDLLLTEGSDNDDKKFPVLGNAPNVLKEGLQFPYFYGAGFVQAMLKRGSWQKLNDAYRSLPASTEQIMHPDKFVLNEKPVKIALADLTATLGANWKQVDTDVNGEFGYRLILIEYLNKRTASTAAQGWGGDKYATYENKQTGETVIAGYTAWDSVGDAQEFFQAYLERTERRYNAKPVAGDAAQLRIFETREGLVSIELRDQDVIIIEGAKNRDQLKVLSQQLLKSKKTMG